MIIDQPCVSCGISLEKGVKTVSIVDFIKGSLGIMISSVFLVYYQPTQPKNFMPNVTFSEENGTAIEDNIDIWYHDGFWISLTVLVVSFFEILLAILLFYSAAKRSVPLLHFWLIITGLLIPVNMFLIKIYEMIVVFAYTEDLTCEAGGKALEEFRKLPYVCNIKTQFYPTPVYGPESPSNLLDNVPRNSNNTERRPTIYLTDKSFLMNVDTSVFSMIRHQ